MKFGKDSDQWPKDSLRRSLLLNYPGCKSVVEALELTKKTSSQNQRPTELSEEYKSMRQIIIDIENLINGYDIDLMGPELRDELKFMPLKNIEDAVKWKENWFRVLRMQRED